MATETHEEPEAEAPVYSTEPRPVMVSEQDIQMLAFHVDTHPERNTDGIKVINRMLRDWMEQS